MKTIYIRWGLGYVDIDELWLRHGIPALYADECEAASEMDRINPARSQIRVVRVRVTIEEVASE